MKKLAILLGLGLIISCSNPTENFGLKLNTDFITYSAMIEFVDPADPNSFIENIEVTIEGADADDILESGATKNFTVVQGRIQLALNPRRIVTAENTVSYRIVAKAPGYLPINAEAYFAPGENQQVLTLNMINVANPPSGVANTIATESITGGITTAPIQVGVNVSGTKKTGASLDIPIGTEMRDANGTLISGGSLEVSLTHFDAEGGDASTRSFPGGFTPNNVIGRNGQQEDIYFNTAGFASINMNVGGTPVKQFSQPISVTMEVDPTTMNMYTGTTILVGDTIPIWSYDVATGAWAYEKTGTVVNNGTKLEMVFTTTHLSWYNLDFKGPRCSSWNANGNVTLNMPGFDQTNAEYLYCDLVFTSNNQSVSQFSSKLQRLYNGQVFNFYNAPSADCKFIVRDGSSWYNKGNIIAESNSFNPCSGSANITINRTPPPVINLNLEGTCASNANLVLKPSFYVYYREKDSGAWWSYLTYVSKGSASTSKLELNKTYEFRVWYNGQIINIEATPDKLNYDVKVPLDASTCNNLI